jgi:hypothetical protein
VSTTQRRTPRSAISYEHVVADAGIHSICSHDKAVLLVTFFKTARDLVWLHQQQLEALQRLMTQ